MRFRITTAVLVAVNVGLAVLLAGRLLHGTQKEAIRASERESRTAPEVSLSLPDNSVDLSGIQAQAVFHVSRSFYVPPEPATLQITAPDYKFTGSMSVPGRGRTAVLTRAQTSERVKVAVGDMVDVWTVRDIGPRSVTLAMNDREVEITSAGSNRDGSSMPSSPSAAPLAAAGSLGSSAPQSYSSPAAQATNSGPALQGTQVPTKQAPRLYRPPQR